MNIQALRLLRNNLQHPHPSIADLEPHFNPDQHQNVVFGDQGVSLSLRGFAALQDAGFAAELRAAKTCPAGLRILNLLLARLHLRAAAAKALDLSTEDGEKLFHWLNWDGDLQAWWTRSADLQQKAEIAAEAVNRVIQAKEGRSYYDRHAWMPSWIKNTA